ncbi:GNAT family N-acetyltransferase [Yoonia sediminilitoris]|uniref:RimJ/RimL family protein N-acetyltransferase n=1 Tax=Yoonia sediminilitoris TaxID=1286148 RepID=A0A2T6K801_9RHOB|nr:GNAT family N-acetyltransferase [Yoonia sediminilitoris]PUB10880.1 RimJ/RimL family protein N-acetyltransferase [Yoonia sediminilitoris]RCW90555.1 RimJ/RimL family protein N-acetyltransferase [Yoonia sediminilitoris]
MTCLALTTDRLTMRRPVASDWDAYHDFMMSDRAAFFGSSGDLAATWKTFAAELGHWQMYGCGMWAVTMTGNDTIIGLVGPWCPPHWPEKEIGWIMLSADVEGKGIATEAARAALAHAFGGLGWETAVSYIWPENLRSIRLAEKLGAVVDPTATGPAPEVLVYRHHKPEPSQ